MPTKNKNGIWFAYIASLLTPFTLLLSGIIAIIYAGYKMNQGTEDKVLESHYYALIKNFFLFLTFFVVVAITSATMSGMVAGLEYWVHNTILTTLHSFIPIVGLVISVAAIGTWLIKMITGMQKLKNNVAIEN